MIRELVVVCSLGLPGDSWFAVDKVKHFFITAFVQSISYSALRSVGTGHGAALGGASAMSAVIGVGKEIHDCRTRGEFGLRDLTWDAVGAGGATFMLVRTRR
ncbi:MAG: hypothetical protein NVS4B3_05540 [Gemmatimonadaceae bacterium]